MIKFYAFVGLLLLYSFDSFSQNISVDSLEKILQNPKVHDTVKLDAIGSTIVQYNHDSKTSRYLNGLMGKFSKKALSSAKDPKLRDLYRNYLAGYYSNLGNEYGDKGDVVNALASFDKSISHYRAIKAYDKLNFVFIIKAIYLAKIKEYDKAIANIYIAVKHFEKDTESNGKEIAFAYSSLGRIYFDMDDYTKSITNYNKTISYYKTKTAMSAEDKFLLATVYSNIASSFLGMKRYEKAIDRSYQSMNLLKEVGDALGVSINLSKIALIKIRQSKFDEAENLLKQALEGDIGEIGMANAYVKYGELYYRKKELAKADHYLGLALSLAKKNKMFDTQEQATGLLIKVSRDNKNFEKALEMHELFDQLTDSSKMEAAKNVLAQQELKYDYEKKQMRYKLVAENKNAAKNNLLIALFITLVLLLFIGYFFYRNNRQKQSIALLEKDKIKQKLLITQMNPHFIFNSVANIQNLIRNKKDNEAINYLTKFSKLTRQILENSNENYILLSEEVEMIKNYLSIQQLLYVDKFTFSIDVDADIDANSLFVPPMLTQPFIENAIMHGLNNEEQGKIAIRMYLDGSRLLFEVTDNGKGFDFTKKSANHKSLAITITKERLVTYTKNQDFELQTSNITNNDKVIGAKVTFEIPYIFEN